LGEIQVCQLRADRWQHATPTQSGGISHLDSLH